MTGDPAPEFDTDPIERSFERLAAPKHVPSLTRREHERFITQDLTPWVRQLVNRFDLDIRVVPPCWARHNGMVEALSALRDHERSSFSETAAPTAALDWFRALAEIEGRLIALGAATRCSVTEHRDNPAARWTCQDR